MRVWLIIATIGYLGLLPFVTFWAALSAFLYDDPAAGGLLLDSLFWVWITLPVSFILGAVVHWVAYAIGRRHLALGLSLLPAVHCAVWFGWFVVYLQIEG